MTRSIKIYERTALKALVGVPLLPGESCWTLTVTGWDVTLWHDQDGHATPEMSRFCATKEEAARIYKRWKRQIL